MGGMFGKSRSSQTSRAGLEAAASAPGEHHEEDLTRLGFAEFANKLMERAADQEVFRIYLFADPDLDGLSAMYALARVMHRVLPSKTVECYQMCNHDTARGDNLQTQLDEISSHGKGGRLAVFLDISPMHGDNKSMMLPAGFDHVFVIDEHERNTDSLSGNKGITVCESEGYSAAGMVYKIVGAGSESSEFAELWEQFSQAWLHRLSIANYTDNGCKITHAADISPDQTRVTLLDSVQVSRSCEYTEMTGLPFCTLWKLKAFDLFANLPLDRTSGTISRLSLVLDGDIEDFRIVGEIGLQDIKGAGLVACFDACMRYLHDSRNWHRVTSSKFDDVFNESFIVLGISAGDMEAIAIDTVKDANIGQTTLSLVCQQAISTYQYGICDMTRTDTANNLTEEAATRMAGGTERREAVSDGSLRVFVMYFMTDVSASVRRAGGGQGTDCRQLAGFFGGAGQLWAAGCGGLHIELVDGERWSVEKQQ